MQSTPAASKSCDEWVAQWRAADMRARLAEEELRSAWNAWFERRGDKPSPEFVAEVKRRREAAQECLVRAVRARQGSA